LPGDAPGWFPLTIADEVARNHAYRSAMILNPMRAKPMSGDVNRSVAPGGGTMSAILSLGSDLVLAAVILAAAAAIFAGVTIPVLLAHPFLATIAVLLVAGAFTKP
jgi:hypothetical protein